MTDRQAPPPHSAEEARVIAEDPSFDRNSLGWRLVQLRLAVAALERIADFDHAPGCTHKSGPVYECGCYDQSQWDIAREALCVLGVRDPGGSHDNEHP